jgi:hypothetical protein
MLMLLKLKGERRKKEEQKMLKRMRRKGKRR